MKKGLIMMVCLGLAITGCRHIQEEKTEATDVIMPHKLTVGIQQEDSVHSDNNSEKAQDVNRHEADENARKGNVSKEMQDIEEGLRQIGKVLTLESSRKEWVDQDGLIKKWLGTSRERIDEYARLQEQVEYTGMTFLDKVIAYYDYEDVNHIYAYNPDGNQGMIFPNEDKTGASAYKKKKGFEELTANEFMDLATKLFVDDDGTAPYYFVDQQGWKADKDYTLLSGRRHWTKFFMVYDQEGKYITGHTWSDKVYHRPLTSYYEKQKAYDVGSMNFDHGTGIALYGNRLFQIYKDKLIHILDYPTYGEMLLSGHDLWIEYNVDKTHYDPETGNLTISHNVSICDGPFKLLLTQYSLTYTWLEEKGSFDVSNESFFDILDNRLIYPAIIEALSDQDMKGLKDILGEKASAKEQLLYFLKDAPDSEAMRALVTYLEKWSSGSEG